MVVIWSVAYKSFLEYKTHFHEMTTPRYCFIFTSFLFVDREHVLRGYRWQVDWGVVDLSEAS